MATIDYPSYLRGAIQQGKRRNLAQTYITNEPQVGSRYRQVLTNEAPVTWSFDLIFDEMDAAAFDAWFKSSVNSGVDLFNMPIRTEQGLVDHEVQFLEIPNNPVEIGRNWRYSCVVQAREIVRPADPQFILDARDAYSPYDLSLLDIVINKDWPSD